MKKFIQWFSETVSWFDGLPWIQKAFYRVGIVGTTLVVATYATWELTGLGAAYRDAPLVYRELEAAGTPLSRTGFLASFAVPDEDNAYKELSPIVAEISRLEKQLNEAGLKSVYLYRSSPQEVKDYVRPFGHLLERAKRAMSRPKYLGQPRFDAEGFNTGHQHCPNKLSRLFAKSAFVQGLNGDHDSAKESLDYCLRAASYCETLPTGNANSQYGEAAEAVLRILQIQPEVALSYKEFLKEPTHWQELRARRAYAFLHLEDYRSLNWLEFINPTFFNEGIAYSSQSSGLPPDPLARAFAGRALRNWQVAIQYKPRGEDKTDEPAWPWSIGFVDRTVLGSSERSITKIRLVNGLIAVLLYQQNHGQWPKNLAQAGFTQEDPYGKGRPLRYALFDGSPRVWSVGHDMKDGGGKTREEQEAKRRSKDEHVSYNDDQMFTLIPPERSK